MLRINIGDQYYASLTINGYDIPFSPGLIKIIYGESTLSYLPWLKISLMQQTNNWYTDALQSGDGALIDLDIGRNTDGAPTSIPTHWRMFGAPKYEPGPGFCNVHIVALLDVPGYLTNRVGRAFELPAAELIKTLANERGLAVVDHKGNPTVDPTSDSQVWRPGVMTYGKFVDHVCDRAYFDDTSYFASGVDVHKTLHFRNITKLPIQSPQAEFRLGALGEEKPTLPTYPILDYKVKSVAGMMNNWVGYGFQTGQDKLSGEFVLQDSVNVQRHNNVLEMNKDLKDTTAESPKFSYRPIDCGNTHENSEKAKHQNTRIRSLYSTLGTILTESMTDLSLFSTVKLNVTDPISQEKNEMYNANYIVTGKVCTIWGTRYYEKFWMTAMGRNADKSGQMI